MYGQINGESPLSYWASLGWKAIRVNHRHEDVDEMQSVQRLLMQFAVGFLP
jgi:hypothetical protein